MGDEKDSVIKSTAEAVAMVVKEIPVYQDAVQPAAKEIGKTLAAPFQLVNTILRPLQLMMKGWNLIFDGLERNVAEKLKDTPPDQIVDPPPRVAGPLMMHYPFVAQDEDGDLRDLFEQLLATAMTKDAQTNAHPAFVEVLKQLTPSEAKLITRFPGFYNKDGANWPRLHVMWETIKPPVGFKTIGYLSPFDVGAATPVESKAMDNLVRLGLLRYDSQTVKSDKTFYEPLENHPVVQATRAAYAAQPDPFVRLKLQQGALAITDFGAVFVNACLPPAEVTVDATGEPAVSPTPV